MLDARLQPALFSDFVLKLLDQLGHVGISPGQYFTGQCAAREAGMVMFRDGHNRAANSIKSNHCSSPKSENRFATRWCEYPSHTPFRGDEVGSWRAVSVLRRRDNRVSQTQLVALNARLVPRAKKRFPPASKFYRKSLMLKEL